MLIRSLLFMIWHAAAVLLLRTAPAGFLRHFETLQRRHGVETGFHPGRGAAFSG